ncbi:MAG: phosphotransferase, partial [Pseudomonadota bacterium]|nr:phosphotransferase [Pseudomonadota bacterium]
MTIHRSAPGLVNHSFRAERAGRQYALRVADPESRDSGFDREWECKVLGRAAAAGLAPAIEHCEPAAGVMVARWVSGRAWTPREIQQPEIIEAMAELLRKVHALPIPQPARGMNPAAWIAHYCQALARAGSDPRAAERRAVAAA